MDLTSGNIPKEIFLFALPILLGQVFQNLYNSVDSIVVENYVGRTALSSVTSCSDISMLLVGCRQLFLAVAMHIQKNIVFVYIGFPLGWFCSALFVMIYYFVKIREKIEIKNDLRKKQSTDVSEKISLFVHL